MVLSKSQIKQLVKNSFPYLKNNDVDLFISISKYEIFNNKEIILKGCRTDKLLFLILKGSARSYFIDEKGHELNCHLRSEGKMFGDPKVFGEEIQPLHCEAIGETHILKYSIEELESLGYKNPEIMNFYLNILKEVILVFSHRIDTFVTMNSKERYIDLIQWNPLYLKSTFDKHIASFLGIKPLTLHRIKKETSKDIK
jgi:CRP-like cAMP-binding protein